MYVLLGIVQFVGKNGNNRPTKYNVMSFVTIVMTSVTMLTYVQNAHFVTKAICSKSGINGLGSMRMFNAVGATWISLTTSSSVAY